MKSALLEGFSQYVNMTQTAFTNCYGIFSPPFVTFLSSTLTEKATQNKSVCVCVTQ